LKKENQLADATRWIDKEKALQKLLYGNERENWN
jgi:hypothetical protein